MIHLPSPALIGVLHLEALPGSPNHMLPVEEILSRAMADANALQAAGFDAAIVENFGDRPFYPDSAPAASLGVMAIVASRVLAETDLKVGINVLRNDAASALGLAAATGASFIRVNVHTGAYVTDQGIIEGKAHETLRLRRALGAKVAIFADANVKHAVPLGGGDPVSLAKDCAYRGLADALVVTGTATGAPVNIDELRRVREAVPDRRVFVGSGATPDTVADLLRACGGVIVGSGIKPAGDPSQRIDVDLAKRFVASAGRAR